MKTKTSLKKKKKTKKIWIKLTLKIGEKNEKWKKNSKNK